MINEIVIGDITRRTNNADIIIGMNSSLQEVTGIGMPFVGDYPTLLHPIELGSVLSFPYKDGRYLHMIICHDIGEGGWATASSCVRFGLDFLWHTERDRKFSIVQIGTGRVGRRDGADAPSIRSAIAESFLSVDLYVYRPEGLEELVDHSAVVVPLKACRVWHPIFGEERLVA